jgi:filamentous hemagglutinin
VATIAATGTLDIMAGRDLSDLAGKIGAGGNATLSAGRNVDFGTIQTGSTYQSQISGYTEKDSSITHQLSQISTGGDLKIAAMGNLNLTGTQVSIGTAGTGAGQLLAGGDVNIAAVTNEVKTSVQNDPSSKLYDKQVHENQTVVGAGVNAAGSLVVGAGLTGSGALNITGSHLAAGDALTLSATDSINIVSAQEDHLSDTASTRSSSSVFKSKTTQQADYVATSQAVGSTVSGKTVDVIAGKDINVLGSAIAGDGDVSLAATGSVNIGASTSTLAESHHTEVKESGFLSGGGFGISYGTRTTTTDQSRDATTQSGQSRSMVGSIGGSLGIVAGDAIKVSGSDLAAGLDMTLDGRSVTIDPGQDKSKGTFEQKTVQDGLTLAVGGSVVNAIQTYQGMKSAASESKDTRVKALAAATAAMAAKNAADDIAKNGVNVSLSLTVGHSESQTTQTTSDLLNSGSVLNAGKDITIRASGAGQDSNINIIGSDLNASGKVTLKADNEVNLLAAQDLGTQHNDSKSMSAAAGIGANIGTKGTSYGFTASASLGRGSENGEGTTQLNSHVTAGQQLAIESGGDTNIKGAVASGTQVVANVGGNLNIESLQDTAKFDSKNQSMSVSGTVGVGASVNASLNQSQLHSDYASVQEQSGIRAGDGGFQVTVGGNTDLKGGVISSSAAGADASGLVTVTLTHSDIANKSTTSGISIGVSGGATVAGKADSAAGKDDTGPKLGNMGPSGAGVGLPSASAISSNESGTTRSGIGAGNLLITDNAAQLALTGQGVAQTVAGINRGVVTGSDTSGRIANNFDANAANAALSVSRAFTASAAPIAANVVGSIAQQKQAAADLQAKMYNELADQAGDTDEAKAYRQKAADAEATAKSWGDNGINRLALHSAAQGLIGGLSNGGAGALTDIAGVAGGNLGQQLGAELGKAAAAQQHLNEDDTNKLVSTYQETFATVGGALAGMAVSGTGATANQNGLATALVAGNTANTVDVYNRQLHDDEIKLLEKLEKGKTKDEQQRLVDAACALVHCSSGLINGPEKEKLKEQEERGQQYIAEQSLLLKTGQFQYGLDGLKEDAASRVYNEAKSALRGAYNLGYLLATHGPYGNVQPPPDLFGDDNGPKLGGGTAMTASSLPMLFCTPNGTCTMTPPSGVSVGLQGYRPSNALLSDGGDTGWNGNSTIGSEATPTLGSKGGNGPNGSQVTAANSAVDAGFDTSNLQSKLGYLLDPTHPQNQTKATWFEQALGFDKKNWQDLAAQIKFNEAAAIPTKSTQYGQTFEQSIPITGVNGRTINTTFVFMKDTNGVVRLITGIPAKK